VCVVIDAISEQLWCHVVSGAHPQVLHWHPPVADFRNVLAGQQDVGWLDVSVEDVCPMSTMQSSEDVAGYVELLLVGELQVTLDNLL
jgi:hypothetical protein